jgi:hypothetical protein
LKKKKVPIEKVVPIEVSGKSISELVAGMSETGFQGRKLAEDYPGLPRQKPANRKPSAGWTYCMVSRRNLLHFQLKDRVFGLLF